MDTAGAGHWDPGSCRDRTSRVFHREGAVFRSLSTEGLTDWEAASAAAWFEAPQAAGKVVRTSRVDSGGEDGRTGEAGPRAEEPESPASSPAPAIEPRWVATLAHEKVPFVSYAYEWPFGMLKDAALLHLEVLDTALAGGMVLKDGSSYNVQWIGMRPVFVDVPSFTVLKPGGPWAGYRQFCRHFLFPLLLQAYRDVPFQPWLRGSLEGISAEDCRQLLAARDLLRPGVFAHVWLQARAEARYGEGAPGGRRSGRGRRDRSGRSGRSAEPPGGDLRAALRSAGFHAGLIRANVGRLKRIVGKLDWRRTRSRWAAYTEALPYTEEEQAEKAEFVRRVVHARDRSMVWDLGCNTGAFARIAAERAATVMAMDSDPLAVERLYRALCAEGEERILPLVADVTDPSPHRGWRGAERRALLGRGQPELILVLALVHHLVIGASIPLHQVVAWLAGLGAAVVVEFVEHEDPMVRALLGRKEEQYADYDRLGFERCWGEAFETRERKVLASGTRILYYGEPKARG